MDIKKIVLTAIVVILLAILFGNMSYKKCCESFTGRGAGRRSRRGAGRRPNRNHRRIGGGDAYRYRHRRRGRRWAGPNRGYIYGPRRHYYFDDWWPFQSNYYVPTATIATVPLSYGCKSGCVNLGNGQWGCQFPGDGITQCQFSADCEACDDRVWWRPTTWFY